MLEDVKPQALSAKKQAQEATTQAIQVKLAVVDVKVVQNYVTENGVDIGGKNGGDVPIIEITEKQRVILEPLF